MFSPIECVERPSLNYLETRRGLKHRGMGASAPMSLCSHRPCLIPSHLEPARARHLNGLKALVPSPPPARAQGETTEQRHYPAKCQQGQGACGGRQNGRARTCALVGLCKLSLRRLISTLICSALIIQALLLIPALGET